MDILTLLFFKLNAVVVPLFLIREIYKLSYGKKVWKGIDENGKEQKSIGVAWYETKQEAKEKIAKFEAEIKKLNNEINSLSDKNIDLESKLLQKGRRIENEKTKIEEKMRVFNFS